MRTALQHLAESDEQEARSTEVAIAQRWAFGATTVSSSLLLAARAGIRVFATGGIGGVHRGAERHGDVSSDLTALAGSITLSANSVLGIALGTSTAGGAMGDTGGDGNTPAR